MVCVRPLGPALRRSGGGRSRTRSNTLIQPPTRSAGGSLAEKRAAAADPTTVPPAFLGPSGHRTGPCDAAAGSRGWCCPPGSVKGPLRPGRISTPLPPTETLRHPPNPANPRSRLRRARRRRRIQQRCVPHDPHLARAVEGTHTGLNRGPRAVRAGGRAVPAHLGLSPRGRPAEPPLPRDPWGPGVARWGGGPLRSRALEGGGPYSMVFGRGREGGRHPALVPTPRSSPA